MAEEITNITDVIDVTIDVTIDDLQNLDVEVTRDIPEQTKSQEITENGTYITEADSGYALSKVTTVVAIPTQEKSVTYNTNGSFEVVPDSGKDLSKVNVDVDFILDMSNAEGDKSNWFKGCQTSGPLHITNVTNKVTNLAFSFQECPNITELRGTETWDVSNVTDMRYMFKGCHKLQSLDLTGWDLSKITSLLQIFYLCKSLTEINGIENWNTENITNMRYLFENCNAITSLDVSKWKTSKVTSTVNMFAYCNLLDNLDLTGWDMGANESCTYMFNSWTFYSTSLTNLIGSHTLAEVEAGTIVALKDMGKSVASVDYQGTPKLLYASALALFNGLYNKTGGTTGTLQFSNTAFNTYTTEQQTTLRTIASNKNYTLTLV